MSNPPAPVRRTPPRISAAVATLSAWAGGGAVYGLWVAWRMDLSARATDTLLMMAYVGLAFGLLGLALLGLRGVIRLTLRRALRTQPSPMDPGRGFCAQALAALGGLILTFSLLLVAADLLFTLAFQPGTPRWWLFLRAGLALAVGAGGCAVLAGAAGRKLAARLSAAGIWPAAIASACLLALTLLPPLWIGQRQSSMNTPVAAADLSPQDTGTRVVLVGLDGATWSVIEPLLRAGRLPQTAALLARGARGTPASPPPLASPITWTTIVTGQTPDVHGIREYLLVAMPGLTPFPFESLAHDASILPFSFVALGYFLAGVASGIPPTSDRVRVKSIWHMIAAAGRRSLVLGIPCTWPAQDVPGLIVSDRYGPNEFDLFSHQDAPPPRRLWPAEAEARIRPLVVDSQGDPRPMLAALGQFDEAEIAELAAWSYNPMIPEPLSLLVDVYDADLTLLKVLEQELADESYAFSTVLVNGLDMTMHAFWAERFPAQFGLTQSRRPKWGSLIDAYHAMVDEHLATIIAAAGPQAVVVLLSDSGMAPSPGNLIWPGWHHQAAFFLAAGGPIRPGVEVDSMRYEDLVPTILYLLGFPLADDLPGRVLTEMIEPEFLARHPPRSIASYR